MKLDKLFQSLLLTGAVVVLISTPARSETNQGESSTATVGESTFKDTVGARFQEFVNSKSPVLTLSNRKHRYFQSQVASSLQREKSDQSNRNTIQLSEIEQISQSAELLVQSPVSSEVIQVTGVQANPTEQGVEVILQTTKGEQLQITNRSAENNFIADIPNAQLRLPNGDGFTFRSQKPVEGITEITVINLDANTIRVTVAGETGLPTIELFDSDEGFIFALIPATTTAMQPEVEQPTTSETPPDEPVTQQDDSIELIVTGQQDTGYRVPNASTATRTDTPLRDIPQSIQVIPQQVLRDQRADVPTALRNAPSVRNAAPSNFTAPRILVRGFFSSTALDGFVNRVFNGVGANIGPDLTGIDRIEVLQGPNAVLFGSLSPGGTVNYITKQPLSEPYYFAEATIGSFNLYRGEVDFSGPLDPNKRVLYRVNASYRDQGSFLDGNNLRNFVIAPVISAALGKNTNLSIEGVYKDLTNERVPLGLPAVGTVLPNPNGQIPRNVNVNEGVENNTQFRITTTLDHRFSNSWSFNTKFRYDSLDVDGVSIVPGTLAADNRTLPRSFFGLNDQFREYRLANNVVGKFSTGSIKHELLFGFDLSRNTYRANPAGRRTVPSIDIFNPIYGQALGSLTPATDDSITTDELGILLQNRIDLTDNLKVLLSGRFDTFTQTGDFGNPAPVQSGNAFSPRVGIVYQPIPPISFYANYSRSFEPTIGLSFTRNPFQPSRGTQYEFGIKSDLSDRLTTTLALYDVTRSNVLTSDPDNPGFSVQTGEQNSRGIELSLAGEILPGWNIFAGYAYNDSRITRSNIPAEVGKRFQRTTPHTVSLWTTYEIQQGDLRGVGLGLGLFYVGDRAGDNTNTFELPSYLTTDLAVFYKQDRFRAAINIRNLFDITYFDGAFSRNRISYGEPFTLQGTVSWTF
ncbi:MAG: TonB-dependent siderophore receptor [Calothrix sp. C42_A2020_038]|nr:TonB-dependent siderophore receptor [Calothrix sp. C42_A2020_038]